VSTISIRYDCETEKCANSKNAVPEFVFLSIFSGFSVEEICAVVSTVPDTRHQSTPAVT